MERIELGDHPHRRHRCWEAGECGHWRHVLLELGVLGDGRWFVAQTTQRGMRAYAAVSERQACTAVEAWLRRLGADWRETTGQDA